MDNIKNEFTDSIHRESENWIVYIIAIFSKAYSGRGPTLLQLITPHRFPPYLCLSSAVAPHPVPVHFSPLLLTLSLFTVLGSFPPCSVHRPLQVPPCKTHDKSIFDFLPKACTLVFYQKLWSQLCSMYLSSPCTEKSWLMNWFRMLTLSHELVSA